MTNEAMRFLALNSVLHGHSVLSGFLNSNDNMAACLGIEKHDAARLAQELDSLPEKEIEATPLAKTLLNYYRNTSYTFVAMGTDIVPLNKFMGSDLNGAVSNELRYMYLSHLLMDVAQGPEYVEPFIKDGVLHCTVEAFSDINNAMATAYMLYMSGPKGTAKGLASSLRKFTSLENYSRLNANTLLRIFRQICREGVKPTIYQQTMLQTSDLLETYTHTGCIMAFTDVSHTAVHWLLDVEGVADSTIVLSADVSTLQHYLLNNVRELANIKAARGLGDNGKILFPGVT